MYFIFKFKKSLTVPTDTKLLNLMQKFEQLMFQKLQGKVAKMVIQ